MRKFRIQTQTTSELILVDLVRFVIVEICPNPGTIDSRWKIIGWILNFTKNNLVKSFIKQAIFFDWLYYGI